jgi:hypothetical protein
MALEPSHIYGHGFLDIIKELKAELVNGGVYCEQEDWIGGLSFARAYYNA